MFFRMVMWPINSEIYFLTITRAFYLPWDMRTLWSQKCNYFTYHCEFSWKKIWNTEKMIESEYRRFLCDGLIQSSAGREHNFRKIGVDIPRLIEWAGSENFSKYQSFGSAGSELIIYTPNAKRGSVWLEKAKKNEEDIIHIYVAVCNSKGISANFE